MEAGIQAGFELEPKTNLDALNSQTKCNTLCIRCCNGTTL
jgi:hypothetical protein